MNTSNWILFFLIFLLIPTHLFVIPAGSQDNNSTTISMEEKIPVHLKLWGIGSEDGLQTYLLQNLPMEIPLETYFPKFGIHGTWNQKISDRFYTLNSKIEYTFQSVSKPSYSELVDYLESIKILRINIESPTQSNETYSGYSFFHSLLSPYLDSFNSEEAYTIHLLNLTQFNNNDQSRNHWIEIGKTRNINLDHQDMRNIAIVGKRGLVFDPTAIAPYFGIENAVQDFAIQNNQNFIKNTLDQLITNVIVGSPLSYDYHALEKRIHVSRILITEDPNSRYYTKFKFTSDNTVTDQFKKLLPYFEVKTQTLSVPINNYDALHAFFQSENTSTTKGAKYFVDQDFAEKYKQIIRRDVYENWPKRYFYSINFYFVENTKFLKNTTDGTILYEMGELGFSVADLQELYQSPPELITTHTAIEYQLKLMGKTFGLVELEGVASQLDTPMTNYGVSNSWNFAFSQFEIDQVARRHGLLYKFKANSTIAQEQKELRRSLFFWVGTSDFDSANSKITIGDKDFSQLNFTGGTSQYLEAHDLMEDGLQHIQHSKNFVINGIYLLIFSLILGYYIKILKESSISKEEFKKRIKEKRERFNI